ncbi:glycosyltransferase family 50 protein [Aaosphaeria arxii CBS 175.79]|uniref:GPI mannosyltransferase 1 n=1 Tax=Aaosphaeria arxii CBS 175.79 TaxID=1450172 RepID=A0A6A5Y9S7_9PLEO|nr:glycosyltransferase family 50 protein [Aaosphaeria arxii CBS 175.79]KAF2021767.1 glycosyltransferase family 50 protein [Aaosphaeria arxii CBS 175.79]
MALSSFFQSRGAVFSAAIVLRAVFLIYGLFQDAFSPMKYTDIDYFVFTDAARFIAQGTSPYARDTYRYTPLLAWMIYPTTWPGFWFSFGKVLFAVGDIVAGWMMFRILGTYQHMPQERALKFASIWLLNPMVATISTRGSSEGLLGVFVTALLWAVLARRTRIAGLLLGFAVHFKIYPFIYAASIVWALEKKNPASNRRNTTSQSPLEAAVNFVTLERLELALWSLVSFAGLNVVMYKGYGQPFLEHSYFYHLIRIDHRHNFSPYNTLLYLKSSPHAATTPSFGLERLAFLPQLLLSAVLIPLLLAKKDLPATMLAQTFAFVTFNKVCTSQYFLWYMMFLPYYLPDSTLLRSSSIGIPALIFWILGQFAWLQQGYQLEFLGRSTFVPGLWLSSIAFFFVNVGILGVVIRDIKAKGEKGGAVSSATKTK